jgi:hypothetical protein
LPHWYRRAYDFLKLLMLPLMKLRSGEILQFVLRILGVSRWQEDDFDMRKSLIPARRSFALEKGPVPFLFRNIKLRGFAQPLDY